MSLDFDYNIECNCVVSIGPSCKAAEALRRNNLRLFSSPFDWLLQYSLDVLLTLILSKGKDFLKEVKRIPELDVDKTLAVEDTKTGIISMHDFSKDINFNIAHQNVLKKMEKRFNRLDKILRKTGKICFVSNREETTDGFFEFAQHLNKKYKFKKIYIINIRHNENESFYIHTKENITVCECSFNDIHKDGGTRETNPHFWKGNTEEWDNILQHVHLTDSIIKKVINIFQLKRPTKICR